MSEPSLRSRLIVGSLLWAVGLIAIVAVATAGFLHGWDHWQLWAHLVLLVVVALVCIVAGLAQLRRGLTSFDRLRAKLAAVRGGSAGRVDGGYPVEVQPLVDDLNALLDHREQTVARALAKAGDLAHGLKTPLAVLSHEVDRARAGGHADLAAAMAPQIDRMRRQIDYHLAHARAAASGATLGARCLVADSAEGLARTLRRLHADRQLTIDVRVPAAHVVRVQREDLDEMIGNLLDNACKWAASHVTIASTAGDGAITIGVDDDGAGLDESQWEVVLQRGVRLDEAAPGSGFGLAIVRDLAELYGGSITIGRSPDGGVRARLVLPAAATPP